MTDLRYYVDVRGLSRAIVDQWLPHVDADAAWLITGSEPLGPLPDALSTPCIAMTPNDLAALVHESNTEDDLRVLVVFASIQSLERAADAGLPPARVTCIQLGDEEAERTRLGTGLHVSDVELELLRSIQARGFELLAQALPNVTPRPLTCD